MLQQQEQQQQQQSQETIVTIEKVMQQEKRKKRPTNLPIASIETLKLLNKKTTMKILQNNHKTTTKGQMTLNNRNDTNLNNTIENIFKADQAKQLDLVDEKGETKEAVVVNKIPKVLNKPEYAWLIEATTTTTAEKSKSTTKRCKSFSFAKDNTQKIADIEKNIKNRVANVVALFDTITKSTQTTTTNIMRNKQIRHSFNCLHQPRQQVQLSTSTAANTISMDSTGTTKTTTSFNLSSHSEALLRTRIPGNTIYYV